MNVTRRKALVGRRRGGMLLFAALVAVVMIAGPAAAQPSPGSIFVDGRPLERGGGNEPFQGCDFLVEFVDFTENVGDDADVTIEAVPPTEGGVIGSGSGVINSGGDLTLNVTIDPTGIEQHVISGTEFLHVHITATANGTTKQKTVWVQECAAPAPPSPPIVPTTPGDTVVPPPSGGVATGTTGSGPGLLLPALAMTLLVASTVWMRVRAARTR